MTSNKRRNVLVVGVDREEFNRVAPFLDRDSFELDRFPSAQGALELIAHVPFEVLVVRFPPPDIELERFLGEVRAEGRPCQRSPLLLLADETSENEAQRYIGRGANRVVTLGDSEGEIQTIMSSLLNVAPRKAARFLTRLQVKLGGARDMILCQTENISASGMLIQTDKRYEKGTKIELEFTLPDDHRPIVGVAEVMRATTIGREEIAGLGVRFLSFSGDSQRRYLAFLQRQ